MPPALLALELPRVRRPAPRPMATAPALNIDMHLRLQLLRAARAPACAPAPRARGRVLACGGMRGDKRGELGEARALGGGERDEGGGGEGAELGDLVDKARRLLLYIGIV